MMGILQEVRGEAALPGQRGGPGELQGCQPLGAAWKAVFRDCPFTRLPWVEQRSASGLLEVRGHPRNPGALNAIKVPHK